MNKKIKIGIECESIEGKNPMFGVGRMIMKLLEELSRRSDLKKDYRFILYFKDSVPDFSFLKAPIFETKLTPVPFFSARGGSASGGKNRLFPIYYFALLPMRLWFDRPDVMFWPNYMLPIIAFGKSLVMLTEDVYYETYEGKLPFRYRLAYGIFGWWTAKFATKIMAISETSKRNLVKLYNIKPDRVVVNYLGVDPQNVQNVRDVRSDGNEQFERNEVVQQAQRSNNLNNYLLFVGQMFPRRHAKETILAFQKIIEEYYNTQTHTDKLEIIGMLDLRLILIGPDKYEVPIVDSLVSKVNERLGRSSFAKASEGQGRIIHKDYVSNEELTELYAGARMLVYVSDREAFGLPPMEALSFGVPPIIADNELGHELFGEYAFYVSSAETAGNNIPTFYRMLECHTPDKIADAMKRALTDNQKIDKIKSEGPEFVKKYNWESFADRFLKIIKN